MKLAVVFTLFQCKAIFFSEQERQQHSCLHAANKSLPTLHGVASSTFNFLQPSSFQSKRNSPVMFMSSLPQNLIKPHRLYQTPNSSLLNHHTQCANRYCDCSRKHTDCTSKAQGSFCVCSSCGKTYENSGDSLSDFDLSVDSAGTGGHKCPNSPSVRGIISDADGMFICFIISKCF